MAPHVAQGSAIVAVRESLEDHLLHGIAISDLATLGAKVGPRLLASSVMAVLALGACGSDPGPRTKQAALPSRLPSFRPPVLPPGAGAATPPGDALSLRLPLQRAAVTPRFANVIICARCHSAAPGAMRDAAGRDVSPVGEWQVSMMGLAARDPYFLAALRREVSGHDAGAAAEIQGLCWRCHAPTAHAEAQALGRALSLELVTRGEDPLAELARGGVDCVGCHAQVPDTLGTPASYSAAAPLRTDRVVYGALLAPQGEAMVAMAKTEPRHGAHIQQSALCGGCHTVIVPVYDARGATGRVLAEQTTYLEWRNSAFANEPGTAPGARPPAGPPRSRPTLPGASQPAAVVPTSCQGCHMPLVDDDGAPVVSVYATRPPSGLQARPLARHAIVGGNAYLLERMAEDPGWLGAPVTAESLRSAAARSRGLLTRAASVRLSPVAGALQITVQNQSGHKLPTGYPSRRMWLHVEVEDARGASLFSSGGHRDGALVDGSGRRLDGAGEIWPHRDRLGGKAGADPVVWEAVPVDAQGRRTHRLTNAERFAKDNRLLPLGWRPAHPDAALAAPRGVEGDGDFGAGGDTVTLELPAGAARVTVELLYQSIPPDALQAYDRAEGAEARRLLDLTAVPPQPEVLARALWTAQLPGAGGAKP